ncbi:MAG TPA: hypothetical protein VF174_09455 [Micromonosporaceae bacterium]
MKPHRTDGVSLTFSLLFLAIAAWWLLARVVHLTLPGIGWFVAAALILLGVLGLVGAVRTSQAAPAEAPQPPTAGKATTTGPAGPTAAGESIDP